MPVAVPTFRFDALLLQRLLRRKAVERAMLAAKVALVVFMVVFLVALVSDAIDNHLAAKTAISSLRSDITAATSAIDAQRATPASNRDYGIIVRANLFGPLQAQQQQSPAVAQKPVNKTPLALIGVFLAEGTVPSAIVEDQKKKIQEVYNLEEMIFDEAKLVAVMPDKIEIERFGQRETLTIDEAPDRSSSVEFKDGVAMVSDTEYHVQEQELDKALENLPLLLTQARAVPYFKDGKSIGLRLFAVKPGSLFERIGLRNGDILKGINGNPLGDLTQAVKLFETLKQEKSINIAMERDRTEREVRYQIR